MRLIDQIFIGGYFFAVIVGLVAAAILLVCWVLETLEKEKKEKQK